MKAIEENDSLLRVGIAFQSMEARHRVSEALERNYERRKFTLFLPPPHRGLRVFYVPLSVLCFVTKTFRPLAP
jgi:hypothetical protein